VIDASLTFQLIIIGTILIEPGVNFCARRYPIIFQKVLKTAVAIQSSIAAYQNRMDVWEVAKSPHHREARIFPCLSITPRSRRRLILFEDARLSK